VVGAWWAAGLCLVVVMWIGAKKVGFVLQAIRQW
jgi:hypothetical protein